MSLPDTNSIIRAYLAADTGLTALVGARIYCPRLPENATLPAVGFFTRGGISTPYIPDYANPSVQFDCWADDPIEARSIYLALYDALQGIQNVAVTFDSVTYRLNAIEEVPGQDLVDSEIPNYFRTLCFFSILIRE